MIDTPAATTATVEDSAHLTIWEMLSFTLTHALISGLLVILSLPGLYRFGCSFGTLEWLINYKRRRRFAAAYERVLGRAPRAAERRRAARRFFQHCRCDKLFYLVFDRMAHDVAVSLFSIGNRALLDAAVARGRGVYVVLAHHGPHHVVAMLTALLGYKVAGVRDRQEGGIRRYVQDRFDRLHPEFRRMRVLYADAYPRDIYRCFEDGYLVGSAMDVGRLRHPNQKGEEVTVFGEQRVFLSGPLRVAMRCRAPVLQAFIYPEPGFRYRLDIVGALVDPDHIEDEDAAVAQVMQAYAANVQKHVRATAELMTRL